MEEEGQETFKVRFIVVTLMLVKPERTFKIRLDRIGDGEVWFGQVRVGQAIKD